MILLHIYLVVSSCRESDIRYNNSAVFNPMSEFMHLPSIGITHVEHEFDRYRERHGKQYSSMEEHEERKNSFHLNLRYIESTNRAGLGYKLALNRLADKSLDELEALLGYNPIAGKNCKSLS